MTRVSGFQGLAVALFLVFGFAGSAQAQLMMGEEFNLEDFESGSALSAANTTATNVFSQLIGTTANTREEDAEQAAAAQANRSPKLFVSDFSYERSEFENVNDGQVNTYGLTGAATLNVEGVEIGLLIPYDHLDFTNLDMDRLGAILYGQYACELTPELTATFTGNMNYLHTFNDILVDGDTYGAGFGAELKLDKGDWVPSLAASYNFAVDNNSFVNDKSHFIKLGGGVGYRVAQNFVANLFAIGNFDASSYQRMGVDTTYVEVGFEGGWNVTDSWKLNLGYKKTLSLQNFKSDLVFLGSALLF